MAFQQDQPVCKSARRFRCGLAAEILAAGWTGVQYRNLTGGIVAVHRAVKPAAGPSAAAR